MGRNLIPGAASSSHVMMMMMVNDDCFDGCAGDWSFLLLFAAPTADELLLLLLVAILSAAVAATVHVLDQSVFPRAGKRASERERSASTEREWKRSSSPSLSLSLSLAKCSLWMILGPTRVISHPSAPYGCFSSHTRHLSSKNRPGGDGPGSRPVVTKQWKRRRTRGSLSLKQVYFVGTRV
jgi:hypothetical protein